MMALVQGSDFDDLFRSFTRSAVRLETRQVYTTEEEREPLRRFLAGETVPLDWFAPWLDGVSAATEAGRQFRRVRIFTEPLADYLRFELWTCQFNVAAGEDILYLQIDRAAALNLPAYDYWLFDDERLALMYFTGDGAPLGAQLVTDPPWSARTADGWSWPRPTRFPTRSLPPPIPSPRSQDEVGVRAGSAKRRSPKPNVMRQANQECVLDPGRA